MSAWEPFTRQPTSGVYWVAGFYPETDCDVDDYGRPIGWHTGESVPFVSLVHLDVGDDGEVFAEALDIETGDFGDEYAITHIMKFTRPKHPEGGAA